MKNIHLLPTEKPSRLTKPGGSSSIKLYTNGLTNTPKGHCKNYHLYITSNENLKEGDWVLTPTNDVIQWAKVFRPDGEKIILTTDQDLIADGVQAIDDEFLEWFVKNPSCEEVKLKDSKKVKEHIWDGSNNGEIIWEKEIIIPQEEPKQETLEEAAKRTYQKGLQDDIDLSFYDGVKLGAKWQSERMYSEEELKNAIEISVAKALGVMSFTINEESFEQFKKK
jgi:hypothetical protein